MSHISPVFSNSSSIKCDEDEDLVDLDIDSLKWDVPCPSQAPLQTPLLLLKSKIEKYGIKKVDFVWDLSDKQEREFTVDLSGSLQEILRVGFNEVDQPAGWYLGVLGKKYFFRELPVNNLSLNFETNIPSLGFCSVKIDWEVSVPINENERIVVITLDLARIEYRVPFARLDTKL